MEKLNNKQNTTTCFQDSIIDGLIETDDIKKFEKLLNNLSLESKASQISLIKCIKKIMKNSENGMFSFADQYRLILCFKKANELIFDPIDDCQTGWICPKCNRIYSPWVTMCNWCKSEMITNLDRAGLIE
jgi:hypothetical protein